MNKIKKKRNIRSSRIDKADAEFSIYIRMRDKKCVRCGRPGEPDKTGRPIKGLQTMHFHSRRKESVRFDPCNADAGCAGCHTFLDGNPDDFVTFKKKQLGAERYDVLTIVANTPRKKDRQMEYLKFKQANKEALNEI